MKVQFLDILRCPACRGKLDLRILSKDANEVMEGILNCSCNEWYPIINGVPRMLTGELRGDYSELLNKHELQFPLKPGDGIASGANSSDLRTQDSFGFEWIRYNRFGWEEGCNNLDLQDKEYIDLEHLSQHSSITLERKTLLSVMDYVDKIVLDCGCGNGRYLNIVRENASCAVGMDLSEAVVSAFENIGRCGNVHIVQADVFKPPFMKNSFDLSYTIGVLHHTSNAHKAFVCLSSLIADGGTLSVHVYHKGNIVWELFDRLSREITTRLPLKLLWYIMYPFTWLGWLLWQVKPLWYASSFFLRIYPQHHDNFDWYSAPTAAHLTEEEVLLWFKERGYRNMLGDNPTKVGNSYYANLYPGIARNSDGTVKTWANKVYPPYALTVRGNSFQNESKTQKDDN